MYRGLLTTSAFRGRFLTSAKYTKFLFRVPCTSARTHIHTHIHTYEHRHAHTHTHAHTRTNTHAHTVKHTHTHTQTRQSYPEPRSKAGGNVQHGTIFI
jgi:hypothetical protein